MPASPMTANKYDIAKQQATERANQASQQQDDAIKRKFASLGTFNSGAALKQQQIAADNNNRAKEQSLSSIDAAQADEESQKSFQREMQDRGFNFQSGESAMARKLQQDLQAKGFDFQGGQSAMDRALQTMMQQKSLDQQGKQFEMSHAQGDAQLELARQQFAADKDMAAFNQKLASLGVDPDDWARIMSGQAPSKPTYNASKGLSWSAVNPLGIFGGFF